MGLLARFSLGFISMTLLVLPSVNAQEPPAQADSNSIDSASYEKPLYRKIIFHGAVSMEDGQIVKGQYGARGQGVQEYEHLWLSTNYLKAQTSCGNQRPS